MTVQTPRLIAVSAARYLKRNGGQYEVELSPTQRTNVSTLLAAIGDFEGCRYVTRCIEDRRFAIMRVEC